MADLSSDIVDLFYHGGNNRSADTVTRQCNNYMTRMFLELDINDTFYIPIMLLYDMMNDLVRDQLNYQELNKIIINLYCRGICRRYKTAINNLKYAWKYRNKQSPLVAVNLDGYIYYVGDGMIFDKYMTPLVVLTVKMKKIVENEKFMLKRLNNTIWINSDVYSRQSDNVTKYIISKIIPSAASIITHTWSTYSRSGIMYREGIESNTYIDINICKAHQMPFKIKQITTPDIGVTDKKLKRVVYDNIEKMLSK